MKLDYSVHSAKGPSLTDCHFITRRWDRADEENACESFVLQVSGDRIHSVIGTLGYYKDLWRSPSGTVFVGGGGTVHWSSEPVQGGQWTDVGGITSYGIWGLSDAFVLGYGDPLGRKMFRFDGSSWQELPAPGLVIDMHGTCADLVVAVGNQGVARLDGNGWQKLHPGIGRPFSSVYVVSEDEMYAILDREQVWQGSLQGWSPVTEMRGYRCLTCIAKWRDRIWVGDSYSGLSVLEGTRFRVVKPKLRPGALDAGETLLVTHSHGISRSENGENFGGFKIEAIERLLQGQKPVWL